MDMEARRLVNQAYRRTEEVLVTEREKLKLVSLIFELEQIYVCHIKLVGKKYDLSERCFGNV